MEFIVRMTVDNAAFYTDNDCNDERDPGPEIARILRTVAERIGCGESGGKARDFNGNTVARFWFEE